MANGLVEHWATVAGLIASIVVILGAMGAVARWAVRGAIETAVGKLGERISNLEGKVEVLSSYIMKPETGRASRDD